ncbi:MAG: pantetheine-phosphate adenylyltransferase [Christensenellales bacterium]
MDRICAVTGSFDPVTEGHVDVIRRAAELFGRVVVLMLDNPDKKYRFDTESRLKMIELAVRDVDGAEVAYFDGYTYEYCRKRGIEYLVRGIRNAEDYEYEVKLERQNAEFGLKTVFLSSGSNFRNLSSSEVKRRIDRGNYEGLPQAVADYLIKRKSTE